MMKRVLLWAALLLLAAASPTVHAAEEPRTARVTVGKPVEAAQQLFRQKKYKEALARLDAAAAVPSRTPYETYLIEETRAAVDLGSNDTPGAVKALEAVLATGMLQPSETVKRLQTLVELDYQAKDTAKLAEHIERYYRAGGTDEQPRRLLAQAYYLQKDYADTAKTIRLLLAQDEKAGKPVDMNLLVMLSSSEYQQKNDAGYVDALERLVARDPKPERWRDLIAVIQRKPGFAPRLGLDLDRLEIATGTMTTAQAYTDAAELALSEGLPGDAKIFLDAGYKAGTLGTGPGAERQKRLLDMATSQSQTGQAALAEQAKTADAAPTGLAWVKLGDAYASYGRFDDAAAAFRKGIDKGGLKNPDDASLRLGVALLRAGKAGPAKEVLTGIAGTDGVQDLARLWLVEGGK